MCSYEVGKLFLWDRIATLDLPITLFHTICPQNVNHIQKVWKAWGNWCLEVFQLSSKTTKPTVCINQN